MLGVWYDLQKVGTLSQDNRLLAFRYERQWLESPEAFPLSPRLPLVDSEFVGEEPLFFFSNLLPEGPLLRALLKLRRLPEGDTFAQLREFGGDAAGAFSILDEGEVPSREAWHYKAYKDADLENDLDKLRKGLQPLYVQHRELRLSLAGAQDKLPVHFEDGKLFLPMNGAPSTFILKPNLVPRSEFPASVDNEALCVALAQEALSEHGGRIAEEISILEKGGERLLLAQRFDRVKVGSQWNRLHQLDFCQLAGVLPDQKYEQDGGPGFSRVFALIEEWSVLPAADRLRALDWALYNFLVANSDAHAKNLAVMPAGRGLYLLAPFYDIVSTGFYKHLTTRLAMKIGGEDRPGWIRAKNWDRFSDEVGMNKTLLKDRAARICVRALARLPMVCEKLAISAKSNVYKHVKATIESRTRLGERMAR